MSERVARSARIALAAGGIAALTIIFAAWVVVRSGSLDPWLTAQIAARAGSALRFGAARAVWWPRTGVVLDDVAFGTPAEAPIRLTAAAAAVRVRVHLWSLFRGQVVPAAVWVDGLRMTIEGGAGAGAPADGNDAVAAWLRQSAGAQRLPAVWVRQGEIAYRDDAGPDGPRSVRLSGIDARFVPDGAGARVQLATRVNEHGSLFARARLDALDDLSGTTFRGSLDADHVDVADLQAWAPRLPPGLSAQGATRVAATVERTGTGAAIEGEVSAEVFDGGITWSTWHAVSPLRVSAHGAWDGHALALSAGQLIAAHVASGALAADTIDAAFDYRDGALRVSRAALHAYGGTWRPAGTLLLESSSIDGAVEADGIDGAQLGGALRALGVDSELPRCDGPLHLNASARGTIGGTWSGRGGVDTRDAVVWSDVRIAGPLELAADVRVAGTDAQTATIALSNGHVSAAGVAVKGLTVDTLAADFTYADGSAPTAALRGTALGGEWTYRGTLPASGAAPWNGELTGTNVAVADLRRTLAAGEVSGTGGQLDLHAQLAGTGYATLGGNATVRLTGDALTWDGLQLDAPADASATLRWQNERLVVSAGTARAHRVHTNDLDATDLRTGFSFADGRLSLVGAKTTAFNGRWRGNGSLTLAPTPRWSGIVVATGVDLAALLHSVPGPAVGGLQCNGGIADLRLRVWLRADGHPGGTADARLTAGSFSWRELHIEAPAHANGTFETVDGSLVINQADAGAARASFGVLTATAATARFSFGGDRLSFSDLRFHSCGGTWTHNGWFTLHDDGPFAGQLTIEGAVPAEILAMIGQSHIDTDFAQIDVDGEFGGQATADWSSRLVASGSVLVTDGTVGAVNVLHPVFEAIGGAGRRFANEDRRTRVQQVGGIFGLRDGRLVIPDLALQSDDFSITAGGNIGLDGSLDLQARIQVTAKGAQQMLIFASIPLPTSSLPTLPPIPAQVTGTLANPVVRPIASALPAATAHWLIESVLHTPRNLVGAIVHRLGELWNGARSIGGSVDGAHTAAP